MEEGDTFHDRPPLDLVIKKFRAAKLTAYVAGVAFTVLFVGIWPGSMLTINVLDVNGFLAWTTLSRGWAYIAAAFIIIVPLVQEVIIHRKSKIEQNYFLKHFCLQLYMKMKEINIFLLITVYGDITPTPAK